MNSTNGWTPVPNALLNDPDLTGNDILVYLAVTSYADGRTNVSYPSHKKIAERARLSERTVRTCLKRLADRGYLEVVPQYRADGGQTSNWYRIGGGPSAIPAGGAGNSVTPPPYTQLPTNNTHVEQDPLNNPPNPPQAGGESDGPPALLDAPDPGVSERDVAFEEWWKAYPKKLGKRAAEKAWRRLWRARALPPLPDLLAAAAAMVANRAAANPTNPLQFVPHPATWLNGELWNDEVEAVGGPAKKQQFWQFLGISRDEYLAHKFDESEAGTVWMQQTRQRAIREGWQA